MTDFEQVVRITGAYDKRDSDPKKNYGICACRMWFILKGPKGAIQFQIGTNWHLPSIQREQRQWQYDHDCKFDKITPEGWDVGYHAHEPQYEGQTTMDCDLYEEGGKCYYDGSSMYADEWVEPFIAGGTEWLWPRLEKEYYDRFGGPKDD